MIPQIMVLDRDKDNQDEVINIEMTEDTIILHALMDVTISLLGSEFPTGTLRFKKGQIIMFPMIDEEYKAFLEMLGEG